MNKETSKFILTDNAESAKALIQFGLTKIGRNQDNQWVFLNDGLMRYGKLKNITYTNKLLF